MRESACYFEQDPVALNRASLRNEGKIHLGLVYAADRPLATADRCSLRVSLPNATRDPGKLTTAPYFGMHAAQAVMGNAGSR